MAQAYLAMVNDFGFFDQQEIKKHKTSIPLRHEEQLLQVYHQSAHVLLSPISLYLGAILIPLIPLVRYGLFRDYLGLFLLYSIVILAILIRKIIIWKFNQYIVTNQRLIKTSHEGLFKRLVIETPLDRILNVSYKTTGIISVMLDFGDVEVQVVGLIEPILLKNIPYPAKIKDYLWQAHLEFSGQGSKLDREQISHLQQQIGYTKKDQRIL